MTDRIVPTTTYPTIQSAVNVAVAGDNILIHAGTYYEEVIIQGKHGTSSSWITIRPYQNEEVIVDGTNIGNTWGHGILHPIDSTYIHITDLKIHNSARTGIWITQPAHYIIMDYCDIYNCAGNGVYTDTELPATDESITYITFQNNIVDWVNNNWSDPTNPTGPGWSSEGVSFRNVQHLTIDHNIITRCGKECIDVKHGSKYGTVHHNIIDTSTFTGDPFGHNHVGVYIEGGHEYSHDIDVCCNKITGNHGNGIVVGIEPANGHLEYVNVFNNIVDVTGSYQGISITNWDVYTSPINNIHIFNNTVRSAIAAFYIESNPPAIQGNILIENNIFTTTGNTYVLYIRYYSPSTLFILNNNLFHNWNYPTTNSWNGATNVSWGNNAIIADPLFNSTNDFHIQINSPAINKGTTLTPPLDFDYDGNPRPRGGAYDIGAYEFPISIDDTETFTVQVQ